MRFRLSYMANKDEILRNDIGKICIPALQFEHHGPIIDLADIGHRLQQRFAVRFGVFTAMVIKRGDDIIRCQCFAVKGHTLVQAEGPESGTRARFVRLDQFRDHFTVMVDLSQAVADRAR